MKLVRGFKGLYSATKDGRIWSHPKKVGDKGHHNGKFLKLWPQNAGYLMAYFYKNKTPYKFLVHRLVAIAYIPNPKRLREVNHKDANRLNNNVENLEWCTSKENKRHAWKRGLYTHKGEQHWKTALHPQDIRKIRIMKKNTLLSSITKIYKITPTAVSHICRRITWKHI